jgi:FkbM family methyltransferase
MSCKTKATTLIKTIRQVKNWPLVVRHLFGAKSPEICFLSFRGGLKVAYRPETADWEVVKEVMLYGVYGVCLRYLKMQSNRLPILDLGANLGLFSLQAANCRPGTEVHAYEPAPRNAELITTNLRANPELSANIRLHREAVGGSARTASFFYSEKTPQGSGLFHTDRADGLTVTVRSFVEVAERVGGVVGLVKLDVEGAEYEIIQQTPPRVWDGVRAISIEIHEDPQGKLQREDLLKHIGSLGYKAIKENAGAHSYFFHREAISNFLPRP